MSNSIISCFKKKNHLLAPSDKWPPSQAKISISKFQSKNELKKYKSSRLNPRCAQDKREYQGILCMQVKTGI